MAQTKAVAEGVWRKRAAASYRMFSLVASESAESPCDPPSAQGIQLSDAQTPQSVSKDASFQAAEGIASLLINSGQIP